MNAGDKPQPKDVEKAAEEARADTNALAAQALDAMRRAVDEMTALLRTNAPAAVSALKEAGRSAGENIGDLAHDARDMGRDRLDDLSEAVKRNPLAWLAAAAGVGLIVGLLNNRGGRP